MSAAEFGVCGLFLVFASAGAHELCRLYFIKTSIELIAQRAAGEISFQSLPMILNETFSDAHESNSRQHKLEREIAQSVQGVFASSLLAWTWTTPKELNKSLVGVRVWTQGPRFNHLSRKVQVTIQVCVQSWLESMMDMIADQRNCLGQFNGSKTQGSTRGVSIRVQSHREVAPSGETYFYGKTTSRAKVD